MSNTYTPSSTWTATVEVPAASDPVTGGVGGAANVGNEDNADRTEWLYDQRLVDYTAQIEAVSGGRATVIEDDNGNWNVMARIPKFKPSYLDSDLGSNGNYHPAFYVNGTLKDEIYIGLFQSSVDGSGNLVSQPNLDAEIDTFSNHKSACEALGTGWHMMSIHEYASLALISLFMGVTLKGNLQTGFSTDGFGAYETGSTDYIKSGSGPLSWRHDGLPFGVADLLGNHYEFVNLFKTVNSELIFPNYNYYTQSEASWTNQGFYYSKDGSSNLIYANASSIDNATYTRDWDAFEWPGTTTAIVNTSLLCDLLLWNAWISAVTSPIALLAGLPGLRTAKLESATHYALVGGDAGSTAGADFGLGYNNDASSTTTGACRLAYIP